MSSLTIHLYTASLLEPNGSDSFFIGNIAPDSVQVWQDKEHRHLRDRTDREAALNELWDNYYYADDYSRGAVTHLWLDWFWDQTGLDSYKKWHGEGWFLPYRAEISKAGSYLFYNVPKVHEIWDRIAAAPESICENVKYDAGGDVRGLIERNYKWHLENDTGASEFFKPEYVENFARETVRKIKLIAEKKAAERLM